LCAASSPVSSAACFGDSGGLSRCLRLPAARLPGRRQEGAGFGGSSETAQGPSRSPIPNSQYRGFTVNEGSRVRTNDVVLRQIGLQFYPGENVRLNRDNWDLVAESNGRLLLTTELLDPLPDSPLYELVKSGQAFEKVFVHVVRMPEDELKAEYQLVSLV
ncbi:hypothetical protein BOX15_Mlig012746g5, partial [Macrostomum lignano]